MVDRLLNEFHAQSCPLKKDTCVRSPPNTTDFGPFIFVSSVTERVR